MDITLTTGQIANCWNDFEKITTTDLQKNSKDFYNIPVSVIVKRKSNNQPVDHLSIENIAMSKDGGEIWFECYINDEQMVEKCPVEPHDAPLDMVVTPMRAIRCGEGERL